MVPNFAKMAGRGFVADLRALAVVSTASTLPTCFIFEHLIDKKGHSRSLFPLSPAPPIVFNGSFPMSWLI
jgi:hypothetical protein